MKLSTFTTPAFTLKEHKEVRSHNIGVEKKEKVTAKTGHKSARSDKRCLPLNVLACGGAPRDVASAAAAVSLWKEVGSAGRDTCAPQDHSPHNSHRPPQATVRATCGPVTPYQHVMGERRPAGRLSRRRAAPRPVLARRFSRTGPNARNFL